MRALISIATLCCLSFIVSAQEQLGIRIGNYAGVNGLLLNPANAITLPYAWDVNLIEVGQFFDNNYAFFENTNVISLAKNMPEVVLRPDLDKENTPAPSGSVVMDFYSGAEKKFVHSITNILGPSFLVKLNEANTIGVFTRARAMLNARDVPSSLSYYEYNRQPFDAPFVVEPMSATLVSWSEIGIHYGRTIIGEYGDIAIGINAKLLQGYEAAYAISDQAFTLTQERGNALSGVDAALRYGFASSGWDSIQWQPQRNGIGFSVDIGTVFTIGGGEEGAYKWKFGASLLDVGLLRFNRSAAAHAVSVSDSTRLDMNAYRDFTGVEDISEIAQVFSDQLLGDPNASLQNSAFSMWMPAAISLQADMAVLPSFFLNASIIQGIEPSKIGARRGSVFALTPRAESRWLEAALPVSWRDWKNFRVGMAIRLAFFYFGTEDFKSLFQNANLDSTDFYFAVKVNPFQLNSNKKEKNQLKSGWGGRNGSKVRAKGNSDVRCPKF